MNILNILKFIAFLIILHAFILHCRVLLKTKSAIHKTSKHHVDTTKPSEDNHKTSSLDTDTNTASKNLAKILEHEELEKSKNSK